LPEPAASRSRPTVEITVDGVPVRCVLGQSLAAAMIAAGRVSWRQSRFDHEERGLFCGIGVCFDCLVTVNGVRSVRACVSATKAGDVVVTELGIGESDDRG
jgi:hypothetical protein